jgi:hypothetical protein
MPKLNADELDVSGTANFLAGRPELAHIRVRKHGALVILESGPEHDPYAHARLRRITSQWWTLEMPTHAGRWEKTPFRAPRRDVLAMLVEQFGWTLQPMDYP